MGRRRPSRPDTRCVARHRGRRLRPIGRPAGLLTMTIQIHGIDHLNIGTLSALPDDAPVVMLNLMRFRDQSLDGKGSGWDAYLRYSALAIKLIKARGGTIIVIRE